jgi:antirestriction protein ArdC
MRSDKQKVRPIRVKSLPKAEQVALRVRTLAMLKFNQGNIRKTSRETGVNVNTIRTWLQVNDEATRQIFLERKAKLDAEAAARNEKIMQSAEEAEAEQNKLIADASRTVHTLSMDKMIELANGIVVSLLHDLGTSQKFYDRVMGFGVVFDKIQIMQGNPTNIRETHRGMSRTERAERAEQLLRTAEERRRDMKVIAKEVKHVEQG